MRLIPFCYFWICCNVSPRCSPSFSWLIPSSMRLKRTRLPTCTSTGLARRELRSSESLSSSGAFSLDIDLFTLGHRKRHREESPRVGHATGEPHSLDAHLIFLD